MHSLVAIATTQEPTTTTTTSATTITTSTTIATNYNHNHRILQQIPNPKTSTKLLKKKKTQNLQQNPNPTDQSMTKLNQPSTARLAARAVEDDEQRTTTVEDDEQRSTTTPGRVEL